MTPSIRPYEDTDSDACHDVYVDAVHNGTAPYYTAEQAHAWAPVLKHNGEWTPRLSAGKTWVAVSGSEVVGFITLTERGHLDFFFVRPAARGSGVATALYKTFLEQAKADGHERLTTHASHLARRFLEKRGWSVREEEDVVRNGVVLSRTLMDLKNLPSVATET